MNQNIVKKSIEKYLEFLSYTKDLVEENAYIKLYYSTELGITLFKAKIIYCSENLEKVGIIYYKYNSFSDFYKEIKFVKYDAIIFKMAYMEEKLRAINEQIKKLRRLNKRK